MSPWFIHVVTYDKVSFIFKSELYRCIINLVIHIVNLVIH